MKKFIPLLLVIVLSYAEFRTLWFIQEKNIDMTLNESMLPLQGKPFWRAHQNRLLSSFIVQKSASLLNVHTIAVYKMFGFIVLTICNFVALYMFKKRLLYLVAFIAAFILLQHPLYFYAWDYLDFLMFTLLAYGITTQRGIIFFTLLFVIGIFNRESAIFIPLWLCIDLFFKQRKDWLLITYNVFLIVTGIFTVKLLRDIIFIRSHSEGTGHDLSHRIYGNHFYLFDNIHFMANISEIDPIVFIPFIAIAFISFKVWKEGNNLNDLKTLLLIYLLALTNICFALVGEMRVWLILIPVLFTYLNKKD